MEDSLSTILYIIIAVGYFLFSILRKSKPKNKPNNLPPIDGSEYDEFNPDGGQTQKRPSFEDLLREFTQEIPGAEEIVPERKVEQPKRSEVREVVPEAKPKKPSRYSKYSKIDFESSKVDYKDVASTKIFKETKVQTKPNTNLAKLIRKQGGLKQAIVLSEVLKTKYF